MSKKIVIELTAFQAQQIEDHIKVRHHGAAEYDTARHLYETIQKQKEPKWEVEDREMRMLYPAGVGGYPLHARIFESVKGDHNRTLVIIDKWPVYATDHEIGVFGEATFYQRHGTGAIYEHVVYLPAKGSPPLIQQFDELLADHFATAFAAFNHHLIKEQTYV